MHNNSDFFPTNPTMDISCDIHNYFCCSLNCLFSSCHIHHRGSYRTTRARNQMSAVVLYGVPIFSYTAILKLLLYYIFVTYNTVSIPTVHLLSRTIRYHVQINCTVCKLIVPCAKSRRNLPYEHSTHGKIWF